VNPDLEALLDAADRAVSETDVVAHPGPLRVGVDLGTAYVVMFAIDAAGSPVAGAYEFAEVVRDGVVVDFHGAVALVRRLKAGLEQRLMRTLGSAATCYPPGVPITEIRATRFVLESAGLVCSALVEEPTAANAILGLEDGAVVDVGGGTTGIAVVSKGKVIYTADEATGGTHFSLVIAGAHGISFEEAERRKTDPAQQAELLPLVRPVMEKVGTIVARHVRRHHPIEQIWIVGGSAAFPGMAEVVGAITGVPTTVPDRPLFVTPLGVALHDLGIGSGAGIVPDRVLPDDQLPRRDRDE
jgi:ethanolamine utilization protein EutJ